MIIYCQVETFRLNMEIAKLGTPLLHSLLVTRRSYVSQSSGLCHSKENEDKSGSGFFVHTGSKTQEMNFKMISRINEEDLKKEFDLIVIGGGINGCGIARDAAERGLKVMLLEKEDFGSGCTSVPTRIIHGGPRYLEHLEFDLVKESLRERELLLKNASHLVRPLEFCILIYKGDKRGYFLVKTGMILYDLLSLGKSLPSHKMMSAGEFINYEPSVKKDGLNGAAVYYDCQATYIERVCLENILMAKQYGALALNHAEVVGINLSSDKISEIVFVDSLSGKTHKARAKLVVNVSGPWVDSLCSLTNKNITRKIGGTKGSHIVVNKFENGPARALFMSAKSDNRPFYIIPWQNYYLIGTTDIPFSGDLDNVKTSPEEIKYLLSEANSILATRQLTEKDILFTYSGVRPLPYSEGKEPGAITRRHVICDHANDGITNFISVVGGKLTTYRNLSEQVVDLAYKKLGYDIASCQTRIKPLIGSIDGDVEKYKNQEIKKSKRKYDLDSDIIMHLISLHGKKYADVLNLTLRDRNLGRLLSSNSLDIRAQVEHAINKELAFTLCDILLRRTTLGLNEGLGVDAIPEVVKQMQELLGMSKEETEKQILEYTERVVKLRKV